LLWPLVMCRITIKVVTCPHLGVGVVPEGACLRRIAMAKAKKRAAARTKSSKHGKASVKSASKKTAKRAMRKQAKPNARRPGKRVTKPAAEATIAAAMETPALAGSENAPVPAGTST